MTLSLSLSLKCFFLFAPFSRICSSTTNVTMKDNAHAAFSNLRIELSGCFRRHLREIEREEREKGLSPVLNKRNWRGCNTCSSQRERRKVLPFGRSCFRRKLIHREKFGFRVTCLASLGDSPGVTCAEIKVLQLRNPRNDRK